MAFHEQAMLAGLTISQWEARKFDKKATNQVETQNGAVQAGRFNKLLIDDAALAPISKVASAMRLHHYKLTMPWGDNGERLLPSRLYFQYTTDMRKFKGEFEAAVATFLTSYPLLVQNARMRLGALYDPADYPAASDVKRRFGVDFSIMPVPSANDFRVDVAADEAAQIRKDIERRIRERQAEALADVLERAKTFVSRAHETLSQEKPRIFDSLMGNIKELATMLPAFNLLGDAKLTQLEQDLKSLVHHPDVLRTRPEVRKEVAQRAALVLQAL